MNCFTQVRMLGTLSLVCIASPATAKTMLDYFQPTPIVGQLSTTVWGAAAVGPRDPSNGIEDPDNFFYWDGKIIKASDGKYHLFCSRWPKSAGVAGWMGWSTSAHAVSDNVLGPYKYQGPTYSYSNDSGHNTTGITLVDGTYGVIESATVPGWIFTSGSLDGPFTYQGSIKWNNNGFNADAITSNLQIMVGPDNRYWAISSHGYVMDSDNIVGTYKVEAPRIYPIISGMDDANAEDPVIWYSGGYYHVVYNYWSNRKMYHLMSVDGIHNWKNMGIAVDPTTDIIRYTDGTVNHWYNLERPDVYMENGHVAYFTFATSDIDKNGSSPRPTSSKVIVVPFDGVSFDADNSGQTGGSGGAGGDSGHGGTGGSASGGSGGSSGHGGAGGSATGGSGGSSGHGGTGSATGGSSGSGVDAGAGGGGGSPDSGGRGGAGGSIGGTTGTAGTDASSGGVISAGGANGGAAGTAGSGGTTSAGGAAGTAGSGGAGGASGGSAAGGSGGSAGAGGLAGAGHGGAISGGNTGMSNAAGNGSSGCSCVIQANGRSSSGGLLLLVGLVVGSLIRRRRARSRTTHMSDPS